MNPRNSDTGRSALPVVADADDAMLDRMLSYLAGELDAPAAAMLERTLAAAPAARRLFATLCLQRRLLLDLHRASNAERGTRNPEPGKQNSEPTKPDLNPLRAKVRVPGAPHRNTSLQRGMVFAPAAALLLAAAAVAIYALVYNAKPETRNPKPASPVATVIETTGTLIVGDAIADAGAEISAGDISLDTGSADFRLTNGVEIALRGQTQLTVHSSMSATLTRGWALFDCPPAAVGYTVHLPGGTRVVDLGTAFGVQVAPNGGYRVWVEQGGVSVTPIGGGEPVILNADDGALVTADGRVIVYRHGPPGEVDLLARIEWAMPGDATAGGIDVLTGQWQGRRYTFDEAKQTSEPSGGYRAIPWSTLIDGVGVPAVGGPAVTDSAGRRAALPDVSSTHTWDDLRIVRSLDETWVRPELAVIPAAWGTDPPDRMLLMCSNKLITFNLAAVAAADSGGRPTRVVGQAINLAARRGEGRTHTATFSVLIDGRRVWTARRVSGEDGPQQFDLPLPPDARFLTLAVTDGGDGIQRDWCLFTDIRLLGSPDQPSGKPASNQSNQTPSPIGEQP